MFSVCCFPPAGDGAGVHGSCGAGEQTGGAGGRPLPAGTCHHVQEGCQVSGGRG